MNQIVAMIRRHWLPMIGLNTVLLAATVGAATIYTDKTFLPIWHASAQLNLPKSSDDLNASLGTLGNVKSSGVGISKDLNPLEIQTTILTSDVVLKRVWVNDPERSLYPNLNDYKQLFEVAPQVQSTIIFLRAEGSHPELAHRRVNTLIQVYQQRLNELRRNDSDVRQQFSQAELQKTSNNLIQAQNALAEFQRSTGLVDRSEQTRGLINTINDLRTTQATVIAEAQANETQAKVAAARLGMMPQQAMDSLSLAENKEYQAIREKLSQVEATLAETRSIYTNESPQVQALLVRRQELNRVLKQRMKMAIPNIQAKDVDTTLGGIGSRDSRLDMLTELIRTQTAAKGLQQQASQLQSRVDKLNAELDSISANQAQLASLQRNYEIAEGVYKGIIAQIQQAKTNPFSVYPNIQTLDEPTIDPKPSEPKRWVIVLGGILASFFGSVALVLLLEARKPLLGPKDLQQVELPVLGRIPFLRHPNMEQALEAEVKIDFQRLASAISYLKLENQRLMVTSSTSGEGKTTVTLGLALALTNFGFRVLIVDADLQQAEMSRRLEKAEKKVKENSKQTPVTVSPGLDLIPAPSMPKDKITEFFARGDFERHLSVVQSSSNYDYVLVDSPPVSLAIEPALISAAVHNLLFVVRPGTSDRYSFMDSFDQLTQHNARIIGLVVNGVESQTEGYRYGRQRELLEVEA